AGIGGYNQHGMLCGAMATSAAGSSVLYVYGTGAPHKQLRLTRLVTMIASNKATVDMLLTPFAAVQADRMVTVEFTKYPEAKGNRGLMKLIERTKDPKRGNRLVYACPLA